MRGTVLLRNSEEKLSLKTGESLKTIWFASMIRVSLSESLS